MEKVQVYDIPIRIFHAIFALLLVAVLAIVKFYDDSSPLYPFHMILGLVIGFVTLLRIGWGFFGSTHARFASFAFHPRDLFRYFREVFSSRGQIYRGHNPASSWVTVLMLVAALGLAFTGFLMSRDLAAEWFEDLHEWLSDAFLILAVAHVVGVVLHMFVHKDALAMSMIHGKKSKSAPNDLSGFVPRHRKTAFAFVLLVAGFAFYLLSSYDSTTRRLDLFGQELQLSEAPKE